VPDRCGRKPEPTAAVIDSQSVKPLLWNLRRAFPPVRLTRADSGYAGNLVTWAKTRLRPRLTAQVVKRTEQHKSIVLPRRWVVERTFSWITRSRRTVRDYERLPAHHETLVHWTMIILMSRRPGRGRQSHPPRTA
jgi:transposase